MKFNDAKFRRRAIERGKDFRRIPFGFHFIRLMEAILPSWLFLYFHIFLHKIKKAGQS